MDKLLPKPQDTEDPRPPIPPCVIVDPLKEWCNGIVSYQAPIGGIRVLMDHTLGNKHKKSVHGLCVYA